MNGFGRASVWRGGAQGFRRGGHQGGAGRGYGWARNQGGQAAIAAPAGYRYVGSCRCGLGPNAYYQDTAGRVVPVSTLLSGRPEVATAQPASEVEQLRAEKAELERRLREMEERQKGTV